MAAQPWEQSTDEQLRPDEGSTADGAGAGARREPGRLGQVLGGRFELRAVLGRGAMGIVYRAHDRRADREVALKLVLGGRAASMRDARFQREGELTARLDHPGIVRVHDAGELDGARFLAYELVVGCRTLADLLGDPAVPRRRLVEVVRDAARALGHAHARGVLHRDVKPSNILVDLDGRTRVADFGLAAAAGLERLTQTGVVVGTPSHMAPEQLDADRPPGGPPTDVWALGVVLYQAITGGALPFDGATLVEVATSITRASPTPPRDVDPTAPPELSDMCLALLRADPARRPPDGEAVALALDAWLAGRPLGIARPRRLPRRALAALAAGLVVGAALTAGQLGPRGDPARDAALEVAARGLCGHAAALGSDRPARARLRAEVAAAPGGPLRQAAGARLDALDALERAARGDRAGARALVEAALASSPHLPGLEALGRALVEDAPAAWDTAYAEGWRRPEVRAGRAVARVAAPGELERGVAPSVLSDLEFAANARGGSAPPVEHAGRAEALLVLGRPVEALAALDAAGAGAPRQAELRWRAVAAGVVVGLQDPKSMTLWLARLPDGPPPPAAAAEAARAAAAAREHVEARLRADTTGDAALRPLVDRLLLAQRLEPTRPLTPDLSARLVAASTALLVPVKAELLGDVRVLLGDDVEGLGQLVGYVRGMGLEYKKAVAPCARRLLALQTALEPSRRVLLLDSLGVLLREVGRPEEALEAFGAGLALCDERSIEAGLHLERGLTHIDLKRDEEALADADAGMKIEPALLGLWSLRLLALRRLGRRDDAFALALKLLDRTDLQQMGRADVDAAAEHAWDLGRQLRRHRELLPRVERYLVVRRDLGLWSVRLGWLSLVVEDPDGARRHLQAAAALVPSDPHLRQDGGAIGNALRAIGGHEPMPPELEDLVRRLESGRQERPRDRVGDD